MAKILMLRIAPWSDIMHGGQLRTRQIAELVNRMGDVASQLTAPPPRQESKAKLAALALRGTVRVVRDGLSPLDAVKVEWTVKLLRRAGLRQGDVVVYDADRQFGPSLQRACQQLRLRLVVLPQNIEALIPVVWPIRVDIDSATARLRVDMHWLAKADAVYAIGPVDRDLLELFGLKVGLLPYEPEPTRRAELLAVREARASRPNGPLLIVGTVSNRPTHAGMLVQLRMAADLGGRMPPVVVAGFGTEKLAGDAPRGVTIVGSQSWPDLRHLMARASALWVHQAPTTGALTRIPEALWAGLPVIGNHWATRNYDRLSGVSIYDDDAQFLSQVAALPWNVPVPNTAAVEESFIQALSGLLCGSPQPSGTLA